MGEIKSNDFDLSSNSFEPPKTKKVYQVWKGRNIFFCGGRLIFGPDASSVLLSTFLIGAPAITFCIKMLLKIPQLDPLYGYSVFLIGAFLTILDLTFLFMTSSSDPGIVPRNPQPFESNDSLHSRSTSMDWVNSTSIDFRIPRTKDVVVNGHIVKVKYCDTCFLYRPPRASHCSICNNCVQRFDHHCPWIGQCIGVRNYQCFVLFISSSTTLCIYVFTFSLLDIIQGHGSAWSRISGNVLSVILVLYGFIGVWFVGGLTFFHFYLMSNNKTTYENFRFCYDKKENPYNKGPIRNFKEILLSKTPPSLVNFLEWVTEKEDSIMGSMRYGGHDLIGSKIKVDLEMGGVVGKDGKLQIPSILQSLDYNGIDDDIKKKKEKGGSITFDPFVFPTIDEGNNTTQAHGSPGKDTTIEDVKPEKTNSQCN